MAYYDVISALSPDFWWRLDGDETDSADAADSDGGTDPSWVSSIIPSISATNDCGDYNGSSSVTDIPNNNLINGAVTYEKSISVWVEIDTIDTSGNGRVIWGEGGSVNGLAIYVYNNGGTLTLYAVVYETSGSTMDIISVTGITTGTLYHIGLTLDTTAGDFILYLNGSLAASKTGGLNIGTDFAAHTAGIAIGSVDSSLLNHAVASLTGFFDGRIADVVYWGEQSVLGLSDFAAIYAAGSGATYDVTPSDTISATDYVKAGYVLSGVTKDLSGSPLGSCHVFIVRDNGDDTFDFIDHVVSNATTGAYTFETDLHPTEDYQVIAWKDDSPHIYDVTDHVLTAVLG